MNQNSFFGVFFEQPLQSRSTMRSRVAQVSTAGARALGAGAGFWLARACLHSRGGRRRLVQAAEGIARAGMGRLGGLYVAAGRGPALDLVCMRTPAHGFGVGVQDAGCCRASASARRLRRATTIRPVLSRVIVQSLSRCRCPLRSLGSVPSSRCRTCFPLASLPVSALLPC